jgi:hypothetical protein
MKVILEEEIAEQQVKSKYIKADILNFLSIFWSFKMKGLLVSLFALIAFTFASYAGDYTGGTETATADLKCNVIAPLTWTDPADVDLGVVVAGTERTISKSLSFILNGEASKNVTITSTLLSTNSELILTYAWVGDGAQVLSSAGQHTVTLNVTKMTADAAAHGDYTFNANVEAVYTGL